MHKLEFVKTDIVTNPIILFNGYFPYEITNDEQLRVLFGTMIKEKPKVYIQKEREVELNSPIDHDVFDEEEFM